MAELCCDKEGNGVNDPMSTVLRTKVRCDGQFYWLRVDNVAVVLEQAEKGKTRGSTANTRSRRPSLRFRRPNRIPICEILAVKFFEEKPKVDKCKCISCGSRIRDRRSLSSKDIAVVSTPKHSISDTNRPLCVEQETEAIALYFVRRKGENIWRVGELKCHFDVPSGKVDESSEDAIIESSPSVTAAEFLRHIRHRIAECPRPKRLLVFINPFGGKQAATQLYNEHAVPIFDLCSISTTVIETQRANHAGDYVMEADLSSYDGIIAAGGDGLFNEVLNGLVIRKQREFKIDINDRKAELVKPGITVGLIAAGSTNALAHTVHGTDDALTSILHIIIGDRRGIDVCGVYDEEHFLRFASTAVSYGFLGDLLKESERLRRFGPPRYIMSGAKVWIRNSFYGGMVRYKTRYGIKHDGNAKNLKMKPCRSNCNLCADDDPTANFRSVIRRQASSTTLVGADEESEATSWSIVDDYTHVVCVVTPCLCKIAPKGISPACHLGDGYMHLALISKLGRFQNLSLLGQIMSRNLDHTRHRRFRYYEVKEFSFTPRLFVKPTFTRSSSDVVTTPVPDHGDIDVEKEKVPKAVGGVKANEDSLGGWNIDGELLSQPAGTIYFRVHRQLITLFARGIEHTSP